MTKLFRPTRYKFLIAMLSCLCLLLPLLAIQVAGSRFEPGDRVVEVAVRYAKEGMEEEFQLARKEITDAVRCNLTLYTNLI